MHTRMVICTSIAIGEEALCIDVPSLSLMKVYGYANKVIVALDLRCNPIAILNLG